MKIGIAHWQGRISPVFDVSNNLCLVKIEENRETGRENVTLTNRDPYGRAKEVYNLGVRTLLCGAISNTLEGALIRCGIMVTGFICGDLEEVIESYIKGNLRGKCFMMPGCFGKRRRHRLRNFRDRHRPS